MKDGEYAITLDEYKSIGIHWIAWYEKASNDVIYFNNLEVKHIRNEIKKIHRQQKYYDKYLRNTSIQFNDAWVVLHWFYAKR